MFHSSRLLNFLLSQFRRRYYLLLHLCYFTTVILIATIISFIIEKTVNKTHQDISFAALLGSLTSAMCVTGMGFIDFSSLTLASQLIHVLLLNLGSVVLCSTLPTLLKYRQLRQYLATLLPNEENPSPSSLPPKELLNRLFVISKALKIMVFITIGYYFSVILLGFFILALYTSFSSVKQTILASGVNPTWFAYFHVVGGFNQTGFGLTPTGLFPYLGDTVIMFTLCAVMLLGDSLFPLSLRIIVSTMNRMQKTEKDRKPYQYMLHHSSEVCTHLFPPLPTRVVSILFLGILALQMITFGALDAGLPILTSYNGWAQFLVTLFQAVNTRFTGFPMFDLTLMHPAMQFLYLSFMVTTAYPFIITMYAPPERATLNDEADKEEELMELPKMKEEEVSVTRPPSLTSPESGTLQMRARSSFNPFEKQPSHYTFPSSLSSLDLLTPASPAPRRQTYQELRGAMQQQLSILFLSDMSILVICITLICIIEGTSLREDPGFSVFKVIFEVFSAYGNVGLSLGYPGNSIGFAPVLTWASQLVLCVVLLAGRHRGLPNTVAQAIGKLPLE